MSTRVTGVLMMVAVCATLIAGIVPLPPRAEARDLRLMLIGCSLLCVLMWMTVSIRSRRAGMVGFDKSVRAARRPSRSLPVLLAVLIPLASGAALVQAVGPDGERGRWVSEAYTAGGGAYEVPIERTVSEPRPTGLNVNGADEHATDVVVKLRFDDGIRTVTVRGARTLGVPEEGDTVAVIYAPSQPGLGVRYHDAGFFNGGVALLWIWAVALFVALFASGIFAVGGAVVHSVRKFRGDVHGVAALVLCLGVLLLLPGAFFYTSTWAGWILALAAASTPWLALTWILKRI
ncbi:hypothetical protein [Streptomyces sp. NPDC056452]|uniref:hypothetical protein n=1 Tax=Streptomyces sp. NPDC056452 TaxID=3345821 RepID=UPI0036B58B47